MLDFGVSAVHRNAHGVCIEKWFILHSKLTSAIWLEATPDWDVKQHWSTDDRKEVVFESCGEASAFFFWNELDFSCEISVTIDLPKHQGGGFVWKLSLGKTNFLADLEFHDDDHWFGRRMVVLVAIVECLRKGRMWDNKEWTFYFLTFLAAVACWSVHCSAFILGQYMECRSFTNRTGFFSFSLQTHCNPTSNIQHPASNRNRIGIWNRRRCRNAAEIQKQKIFYDTFDWYLTKLCILLWWMLVILIRFSYSIVGRSKWSWPKKPTLCIIHHCFY